MLKEFTHIYTHTHRERDAGMSRRRGRDTIVPIPTMAKESLMNIYDARDAGPVGLSA